MKEDTFDWFAQEDRGDVWYLGEETKEDENGEVISTAGPWEAGVDGAGSGDIYRQELYAGEAEDMAGVHSRPETVSVPFGSFRRVLMMLDYNPLDEQLEHKYYAPGSGMGKSELLDGEETTVQVSITQADRKSRRGEGRRGCGSGDGSEEHDEG